MKSLSKTVLLAGGWLCLWKLVSPVSATAEAGIPLDSFRPTTMVTDTEVYFGGVVNLVFIIAAALVFFYLIYGAIGWITSSGDTGKLQTAKNRMIQSVIGLFVLMCIWALYTFFIYVTTGQNLGGDGDIPLPTLGS